MYRLIRKITRFVRPFVSKIPLVPQVYRFIRDALPGFLKPMPSHFGFSFAGRREMRDGKFEPDETRLVQSILADVELFINVGANIGYYCCLALANQKYTIAFEPERNNLKVLYKNVRANNWENNIEIFPIALSDHVGLDCLYGTGTGASLFRGWAGINTASSTNIPINTLDNIIGPRLPGKRALILIDVEGSEYKLLNSSTSVLKNTPHPIWVVEINIFEHQPSGIKINPNLYETFKIFWDFGYSAFAIGNELTPISQDAIAKILETHKDPVQRHNFIFVQGHESEAYIRLEV